MVKCAGTKYKLDASRLYIGGISSGGTMANRALLFRLDFWAGGMPISGEWYTTPDDGSFLSFQDSREAVRAAPAKIHQGRAGPFPLPETLGPMIVITVWGGGKDLWDCGPPTGLCSDYRPTTQASSNYFSSKPNVVHVACTAGHGHMWPQVHTQEFNLWALTTLASFHKGSDPQRSNAKGIEAKGGILIVYVVDPKLMLFVSLRVGIVKGGLIGKGSRALHRC